MAFTAAATGTPVPGVFSSKAAAAYAGRLCISASTPAYSRLSTTTLSSSQLALAHSVVPLSRNSLRPWLLRSALQEAPAVAEGEVNSSKPSEAEVDGPTGGETQKRKLYVVNLPWDLTAAEIESLFAECGTVKRVEVMKLKNGKNRGFAFVTMGSEEEAKVALEKLDSHELQGRIIRVEYAKNMKKPSPPPAPLTVAETRHLVYVSNLAWKVRSNNLREFFAASFNPTSARVVFDSPTGRSSGYGFVSFATAEEAEAAVSELNEKELMGRPLRLKISESKTDKSSDKQEETSSNNDVLE